MRFLPSARTPGTVFRPPRMATSVSPRMPQLKTARLWSLLSTMRSFTSISRALLLADRQMQSPSLPQGLRGEYLQALVEQTKSEPENVPDDVAALAQEAKSIARYIEQDAPQ